MGEARGVVLVVLVGLRLGSLVAVVLVAVVLVAAVDAAFVVNGLLVFLREEVVDDLILPGVLDFFAAGDRHYRSAGE